MRELGRARRGRPTGERGHDAAVLVARDDRAADLVGADHDERAVFQKRHAIVVRLEELAGDFGVVGADDRHLGPGDRNVLERHARGHVVRRDDPATELTRVAARRDQQKERRAFHGKHARPLATQTSESASEAADPIDNPTIDPVPTSTE